MRHPAIVLLLGSALALAYVSDWPASFWIVLLSCAVYFLSLARPAVRPLAAKIRGAGA